MKTLILTVKGIAQRVGYRSLVERTARRMGLKGYVKNLDDSEESVEIAVQTTDKNIIQEFLQKINISTGLVDVRQIIKTEREEKEFEKFEVKRGSYEKENAERLDIAAYHLDNLTSEVDGMNDNLGSKMDKLNDKQNTTIKRLEEFNNTTQQQFQRELNNQLNNYIPKPEEEKRKEALDERLDEIINILQAHYERWHNANY